MSSKVRSITVAKQRVLKAAVAHAKAYDKAEKLWHNDGDDPPDWQKRMSRRHDLMEKAVKRLLKATKDYVEICR